MRRHTIDHQTAGQLILTLTVFFVLFWFGREAQAAGGLSVQLFGGGWDTSGSGRTTGYGLRTTLGREIAVDAAWTSYTKGNDITISTNNSTEEDSASSENTPTNDPETTAANGAVTTGDDAQSISLGGIGINLYDLGFRYTLPTELYFGAGLSYLDFDTSKGSIDGEMGFYGLCGWSFGDRNLRGFIEANYRYAGGTVSYNYNQEVVKKDVDHNGFGINMGIMFRF
ncbi:MAG: hypothetical protein ABFS19_06330 [Thermodesulfobacteriota bacterium]